MLRCSARLLQSTAQSTVDMANVHYTALGMAAYTGALGCAASP